ATAMNVALNMVVFSYLDRPIFDIFVDGKGGDSSGPYPQTGGSTISGVTFKVGPQKVSWVLGGPPGTPHNGETVTAKNVPVLQPVEGARYLALHIYKDSTVELITSKFYPDESPRGMKEQGK
ncbi:conserved hypothetical protein, partial [Ricinus communis]